MTKINVIELNADAPVKDGVWYKQFNSIVKPLNGIHSVFFSDSSICIDDIREHYGFVIEAKNGKEIKRTLFQEYKGKRISYAKEIAFSGRMRIPEKLFRYTVDGNFEEFKPLYTRSSISGKTDYICIKAINGYIYPYFRYRVAVDNPDTFVIIPAPRDYNYIIIERNNTLYITTAGLMVNITEVINGIYKDIEAGEFEKYKDSNRIYIDFFGGDLRRFKYNEELFTYININTGTWKTLFAIDDNKLTEYTKKKLGVKSLDEIQVIEGEAESNYSEGQHMRSFNGYKINWPDSGYSSELGKNVLYIYNGSKYCFHDPGYEHTDKDTTKTEIMAPGVYLFLLKYDSSSSTPAYDRETHDLSAVLYRVTENGVDLYQDVGGYHLAKKNKYLAAKIGVANEYLIKLIEREAARERRERRKQKELECKES